VLIKERCCFKNLQKSKTHSALRTMDRMIFFALSPMFALFICICVAGFADMCTKCKKRIVECERDERMVCDKIEQSRIEGDDGGAVSTIETGYGEIEPSCPDSL
jgi:hypothetical protein